MRVLKAYWKYFNMAGKRFLLFMLLFIPKLNDFFKKSDLVTTLDILCLCILVIYNIYRITSRISYNTNIILKTKIPCCPPFTSLNKITYWVIMPYRLTFKYLRLVADLCSLYLCPIRMKSVSPPLPLLIPCDTIAFCLRILWPARISIT